LIHDILPVFMDATPAVYGDVRPDDGLLSPASNLPRPFCPPPMNSLRKRPTSPLVTPQAHIEVEASLRARITYNDHLFSLPPLPVYGATLDTPVACSLERRGGGSSGAVFILGDKAWQGLSGKGWPVSSPQSPQFEMNKLCICYGEGEEDPDRQAPGASDTTKPHAEVRFEWWGPHVSEPVRGGSRAVRATSMCVAWHREKRKDGPWWRI
jgi:hypothetical protein